MSETIMPAAGSLGRVFQQKIRAVLDESALACGQTDYQVTLNHEDSLGYGMCHLMVQSTG